MRRAIYFLIGIVSVAIVFIFMLTTSPKIEIVKTSLADFHSVKDDEVKQRIEDIDGSYSSFLEYGSYHLNEVDHDYYVRKGTVNYGKINPMFYFAKKTSKPLSDKKSSSFETTSETDEMTTPEESSDSNNQIDNSGGIMKQEGEVVQEEQVDLSKPVLMKGFNIITNEYEEVNAVIALKDFQEIGKLPVDLKYYNISSPYGERIDPLTQVEAIHTGLDIAVPEINEKNVYASSFGEVIAVNKGNKGYGNHVIIRHNGYDTLYGHLSYIENIKVGDKTYPGTIIGKVGSTGRSTNPHLHFEVRIDNVALDPTPFVNKIRKVVK